MERVGLTYDESVNFEHYVRAYCHNLLSDGILNYQGINPDGVQLKISYIVTHNIVGIQLFMRAIEDISDYQNSGDEHTESKFNPIDNDNIAANLVKEDTVQHHTLKSLGEAMKIFPEANKILADIYSELSHICMPCLSADIISNITIMDLNVFILETTVHVAQDDDDMIKHAIMEANPFLGTISTLIETYMVLKPDPVQPDVRWLSLNYQP
jgi:hypothetical protein